MDNKNSKEKPLNIKVVLEKDNYIIPIYQRNCAWGQPEIEQLINDISNAIENGLSKYYIGTLVVFEKENYFEIIDGQQRHTTFSLIHATIQNRFNSKLILNKSNLHYEARKESKVFFDSIYSDFDKALKTDNVFSFAINQIILPLLNKIGETGKLDKWITYFHESVLFFRVEVPADTDLHHYFETMNNRGEQLEESEVLKAKFMSSISDYKEKVERFSTVWDKCSNMFSYYNEEVSTKESDSKTENGGFKTLSDLLSITKNIIKNKPEEYQKLLETEIDRTQSRAVIKYNSIINFPNFLLIALKLIKTEISLNEKNLLREFGYFNEKLIIESEDFINHLEKCREIFDCYFVKRNFEDNQPYWVLLNNGRNTFTKEECVIDEDENNTVLGKEIQDKLIKIQSMLQSVYFSNVNKEWLFEGLKIVLECQDLSIMEIGNTLFNTLFQYSKDKFEGTIDKNTYLPIKEGLEIPRITFYFIDYLLWETYYSNIRGLNNATFEKDTLMGKIDKMRSHFSRFHFKQYSSIEHYYPQNPEKIEDKMQDIKTLNCFGNLCLISRSANSRYSNFMPLTKRNEKQKSIESLKQGIMFWYDSWNEVQIQRHDTEMKELIKNSLNSFTS